MELEMYWCKNDVILISIRVNGLISINGTEWSKVPWETQKRYENRWK